MKKGKRSINLIVVLIAVLMAGLYCVSAVAKDLRVGVYSGIGQQGIIQGLTDVKGVEVMSLESFSPMSLSGCDVVIWPHGRVQAADHARLWRVLLTEYVKAGGGLILTHDAVGGAGSNRGDLGERPLFGDIARSPGYAKRKDKTILMRTVGTDHPLAKELPDKLTHAYYDHHAIMCGPNGTTVMQDEDGDPVVVVGEIGKGRVVLMGNLPGYKGTRTFGKDGSVNAVKDQGPAPLADGELTLMAKVVKWAGVPLRDGGMAKEKLEKLLELAETEALAKPAAVANEAIVVFSEMMGSNNYLDRNIWELSNTGPCAGKWGTWFSSGLGKPFGNVLATQSPNQPIATRSFKRSPVQDRFVFTGKVALTSYYAGVLEWFVIDETANKDIQDGYGFRLVYGGVTQDSQTGRKPPQGYAFRRDHRLHRVKIGNVRHAILKMTRGKVTELAVVEAPGRFVSPKKGAAGVPVRFERGGDGALVLSLDGLVVARVKDDAYTNFTKLRAVMTSHEGRLGFDDPTLIGYFAKEEQSYTPTPWIVPEPKQITKNGKKFALSDGSQFVVSSKEKIKTYLLDEWIIPEIEGRYGIKMKAVTLDEMDKSKPAIYLGEGNDPAFARIFNKKLKAISKEDPGPASGEGYVINANAKKVYAAGAGVRGAFYALQSIVQLISREDGSVVLRGAEIKDWPDFRLRGSLYHPKKTLGVWGKWELARKCVRMFARYKANAFMVGGTKFDFPSYDLGRYSWSFKELAELYQLFEKYHIEVIPSGHSLCHTSLKSQSVQKKTKLWKWIVDNKIIADWKLEKHKHYQNSYNAMSPLALDMCKKLNQDLINISPKSNLFLCWFDEISPPIHTYAPKGTEADLLEKWILALYKQLKDNGKRMMMFPSYLTEATRFPGSSASLGRTDSEGMPMHDVIDRIPKDIIMADWYYGTSPDRSIYKYLRDKGFDVIAMPSAAYGYSYESVYYAAVEGKKAGIMGIIAFGFSDTYINPTWGGYALPWIYGWTVPKKMKPDWCWQEHWQEVFQEGMPSHTGEIVTLDISDVCNESRIDEKADDGVGWLDYGKHSDLRKLSAGPFTYNRYRFNIVDEAKNDGKSVVIITARDGQKDDERTKVDISIGSKARALVFLHVATSLGKVYPGAAGTLCRYRVTYEDGTSVDVHVSYGHHIGPWIYSAGTGHPRLNCIYGDGYLSACRLLKTGRTTMGEETGLYAYEWPNPHPDKKIASITMRAGKLRDWVLKRVGAVRIALVALSVVK